MSTVLEQQSLPEARTRRGAWLIVAALLALYVPTCIDLACTLWREEDYAHGPIILAVALFLFWKNGVRYIFAPAKMYLTPFLVLLAGLIQHDAWNGVFTLNTSQH